MSATRYTSSPGEDDVPIATTRDAPPAMSMKRARWLLNLDKHTLHDILDTLVEAGYGTGILTRDQFVTAMLMLMNLGGNLASRGPEYDEALSLIERIYAEFTADGADRAELTQLTSGLSILCSVTLGQKVDFAFALYDMDFDGLVSYDELVEYMASVFKVLFVTTPGTWVPNPMKQSGCSIGRIKSHLCSPSQFYATASKQNSAT
jgi:hypothetical protein